MRKTERTGLTAERSESSLAIRGLLVVALALIFGSGLPALLAYYGDVFTQDEIRQKLPPIARQKISAFEEDRERLDLEIRRIDSALEIQLPGSEEHHRLLESRQAVRAELKMRTVPLQYYGYMGSQSAQFYYPLFFLTLGTLVLIARPAKSVSLYHRKFRITIIMIGIYISWQWFHWIRNFVSDEESRVIYTYTNWDIGPYCYLYQEFEAVLLSFLIATIWCQWLELYEARNLELELQNPTEITWSAPLHHQNTERLSETFSQWQKASLLLVAAFTSFFAFYWRNIQGRGDLRYLISALVIHVVGIVSWIIVSLPMTITWKHWHDLRARAIYELVTSSDETARIELRTKMIDSVKPIGSWNLLISTTLLFITFIIPIVQMVIR